VSIILRPKGAEAFLTRRQRQRGFNPHFSFSVAAEKEKPRLIVKEKKGADSKAVQKGCADS